MAKKPRPQGVAFGEVIELLAADSEIVGVLTHEPIPYEDDTLPTTTSVVMVPEYPFPVGTRLRYIGHNLLFAGYQCIPVLDPGHEYVVAEVSGRFSFLRAEMHGHVYRVPIRDDEAGQWFRLPD